MKRGSVDVTESRSAMGEEPAVGGEIVSPRRGRPKVSARLAWIAIAPFAAWAVVRLGGLERGSFLTQLMTATPYAVVASLVPLLLAVASRRRLAIAVAVLVTATLAAVVAPRTFAVTQRAATGPTLRVLSTNLLFGRADADAVVDLVRRLRPDVLSAQELSPAAVLELDEAGLKELLPYRVLQDEFGAGGSGLYARYPLTEVTGLFEAIGHNMPAARLTLPGGGTVELVAVHTYPPLGPWTAQWRDGLRALPSAPSAGPYRILAGDFNATLDHAEFRALVARGYVDAGAATGNGLVPTWPANRRVMPPIITIDHVLADRRLAVTGYAVHTLPRTDHRAVFTEVRLPR